MKQRSTIIDAHGRTQTLSPEVFIVKYPATETDRHSDLQGTRVRLISGVQGNPTPGFHFVPGWVTVCPEDQPDHHAYFCGVKRAYLKPAK